MSTFTPLSSREQINLLSEHARDVVEVVNEHVNDHDVYVHGAGL